MAKGFCLLLFAAGATSLPTGNAAASTPPESPTVTVEVTGYGASVGEARADAVRQAMQRALSQLVVSDVEVNQDQILQDRVMSTMNGFVDRVEERSLRREGDEVIIDSTITVSTKRIGNFLGLQSSATEVDGLSLFSELNRETEQRAVVTEILARAFRGFPSRTIDTEVTSIRPAPDSPEEIVIDFTFEMAREWIQSLNDTLRALSTHSFDLKLSQYRDSSCLHNMLGVGQLGVYCGGNVTREVVSIAAQSNLAPICVISPDLATCHILPYGDYKKAGLFTELSDKGLIFLVVPLDENGNLTSTEACCPTGQQTLRNRYESDSTRWDLITFYGANSGERSFDINRVITKRTSAQIRIRRSDLDLPRTKSLTLVPALIDHRRRELVLDISDYPPEAGASQESLEDSAKRLAREALLNGRNEP